MSFRIPRPSIEAAPKLQTLKRKIRYDKVNEEAERRLTEKHIQTSMEVDQETEWVQKPLTIDQQRMYLSFFC